jgi:hypothetical protein
MSAAAKTKRWPFLECSLEFRSASAAWIAEICNGCGARDGINVPDTIYGLNITRACNIHDWDYQRGVTTSEKDAADRRFSRNLQTLIDFAFDRAPKWQRWLMLNRLLRWLRGYRAHTYYLAVHYYGKAAYWAGK